GALHQVVECCERNEACVFLVDEGMHEAPVAAERGLRRRIRIEYADEGLLGVFARVRARNVPGAFAGPKRRVAGCDETAVHRDEMWSERQARRLSEKRRRLLRDLRRVPMLR